MKRSKPQPAVSDSIQKYTGEFGKYQLWLYVLMILPKFSTAHHQIGIIFLAPKVEYTCNGLKNSCPCENPEYDKSTFSNTIIMQWNLICENKWKVSLAQTIFQLGTLAGSIIFGMASDRYGRRRPLIVAVSLEVSMGIAAAFAPNYWSFSFIRFLIGTSIGGILVITYVILMGYIGIGYRETMSTLYHLQFIIGHLTLPLYGYFFRNYRDFQLAISIPTVILFSYYWLAPETPRWLIAVNRPDEAVAILERVAKINNLPTENLRRDVELYRQKMKSEKLKEAEFLDLFRTPNLRKNILAMSFNWLSCGYCFYGVSQYVGQLSGDIFLNVAASAGVTFFGTLVSLPMMKMMGRKTIVFAGNATCGICLLIVCFVPHGVVSVVCASIGVVSSFITFVVVYLYASEMFPTVVRNAALGFSSMMARVGSMVAPYIIQLRDVAAWVPPLGFAVIPIIAMFISMVLPETKGHLVMNTIEEAEAFGNSSKPLNKNINLSQAPKE